MAFRLVMTTQTVLESTLFDRVVVSTDDEEVARIAEDAGASVPFMRSAELADDHTGTRPVVQDALRRSEEIWGTRATVVGCVYPTAVLVKPTRYREAAAILEANPTALVQTGVEYPHPIERAWRAREDGRCERLEPRHASTRTQDLEPRYFDAGQFYLGMRDAWIGDEGPDHTRMLVLGQYEVIDVDTPTDWRLLERLYPPNDITPPHGASEQEFVVR